jgi:hypothetical protein
MLFFLACALCKVTFYVLTLKGSSSVALLYYTKVYSINLYFTYKIFSVCIDT